MFTKRIFHGIFVLGALLVVSCGTSHSIKVEDEFHGLGFDFNQLIQHGIAVYGVPGGPIPLYPMQRIEYSSLLNLSLSENIKNVQVPRLISPMEIIDIMGKDQYIAYMEGFDMLGHASSLTSSQLNDSLLNAGYALFAEIEKEREWKGESEDWTSNEKGESVIEIEYYHIFQMTIEFRIYEVESGTFVYSTRISDEARVTEDRTRSAGCIQGMIDDMVHSLFSGPPPEISQREVVVKIFKEFTKVFQNKLSSIRPALQGSLTP